MQTTRPMAKQDRAFATAKATVTSNVVNTTNAPLEPYSFVGDDQKMQVENFTMR